MLTDLSTNGVFLTGQSQAIGRGHSCALEDGDGFSLGPYLISAAIEGRAGEALQLEQGLGLPQEDEEAIFPTGGRKPRADGASPIAPAIAEPWLTDIPGGSFGPGRRAAPQGWDAPPDPATYAASGVFEARDPLDPRRPDAFTSDTGFTQHSEHLDAPSTVMRVPQAQVVLPMDWNEVPAEAEPALPPASAPEATWPPLLPTEPAPAPAVTLPPEWIGAGPDNDWDRPAPPAALPASWVEPEEKPAFVAPPRPLPAPVLAPMPAPLPVPEPVAEIRAPAPTPPPAPRPAVVQPAPVDRRRPPWRRPRCPRRSPSRRRPSQPSRPTSWSRRSSPAQACRHTRWPARTWKPASTRSARWCAPRWTACATFWPPGRW